MKQTINITKMITMGLFTLCTMGLTAPTFAGAKSENPAELKFVGKIKDQPVFQLNLHNKDAGEYFINIKDENYNVLYSERVKGTEISRNYQLDIDNAELNAVGFGVTVEVISVKTHKTEVYKISTHTSVTSNIVVAKL